MPIPKGVSKEKFLSCERQVKQSLRKDKRLSEEEITSRAIAICTKQLKGELIESAIYSILGSGN